MKEGLRMKTYKITYKQKFDGEILTDSYLKTVNDISEMIDAENALYSDPCVFSVDWVEVK